MVAKYTYKARHGGSPFAVQADGVYDCTVIYYSDFIKVKNVNIVYCAAVVRLQMSGFMGTAEQNRFLKEY